MTPIRRPSLLLGLAFLLGLVTVLIDRHNLHTLGEEFTALREANTRLLIHRDALKAQINSEDITRPFLTADVQIGGSGPKIHFEEPLEIVLYRMSTECPHCAGNLPFLNALADSGATVVAIATDSSESVVEDYWARWNVRFPVLLGSSGSAVNLVPRHGTPTTVVVLGKKVQFLEFGELSPDAQKAIRLLAIPGAQDYPVVPQAKHGLPWPASDGGSSGISSG